MKILLRLAWFLGIAPLVVGVGIFVSWLILRADRLMLAGVVTLQIGICAVAAGIVCLVIYLVLARRSGQIDRRRLARQAVGVLALYLIGFAAAGGAVVGGIMIETRYTVSITNHSEFPLRETTVEGGGVSAVFGDIPPGRTTKRSFWIETDGTLVLTGLHDSQNVQMTIDEYVTNNQGGNRAVVLDQSGAISVRDRRADAQDPVP